MSWRQLCEVRVDGIPKGQPRARSRRGFAGVYDPGTADGWRALVADAMRQHRPESPIDAPVHITVILDFPRPKSFNKRTRGAYGGGRNIPKGRVIHTSKPDRDNADKAILDTLTQIGFLRDDSLVCAGSILKYYHAVDGRPGATIVVNVWEAPE